MKLVTGFVVEFFLQREISINPVPVARQEGPSMPNEIASNSVKVPVPETADELFAADMKKPLPETAPVLFADIVTVVDVGKKLPVPETVALLFTDKLMVVPAIFVIVAPAPIPVPETFIPKAKPALLPTVIVVEPKAPLMVVETDPAMEVIVDPGAMPVPSPYIPTAIPLVLVTLTVVDPELPVIVVPTELVIFPRVMVVPEILTTVAPESIPVPDIAIPRAIPEAEPTLIVFVPDEPVMVVCPVFPINPSQVIFPQIQMYTFDPWLLE